MKSVCFPCVCFISVNVVILVLLSIAFLIIVHRNLLNLSDFLKQDSSGSKFSRMWLIW